NFCPPAPNSISAAGRPRTFLRIRESCPPDDASHRREDAAQHAALRRGALLIRGPSFRTNSGSRLCGAPLKKRCTASGPRGRSLRPVSVTLLGKPRAALSGDAG